MAESGYSRPTLPQLITTIRSDIFTRMVAATTLAELRRSDAEVYARVQAAAVHTVYGYIDYLAHNLLPDLADQDWLTRHGNMKKVPRKVAVAAAGYPSATITRYQKSQFTCLSSCTESLYSNEWRYYWQVNINESAQIQPMTAISNCTASLRTWGDTVAECVISKMAPLILLLFSATRSNYASH